MSGGGSLARWAIFSRFTGPLLHTLHFFDNASDTPRLIFKDEAGQTTINDAALYEQLRGQFAA